MINPVMCQVCNDARRFRLCVDDARRIRINLARITGEDRISTIPTIRRKKINDCEQVKL